MDTKDTEKFVLVMSTNPYQAQRTARALEWLKRPAATRWAARLHAYFAFDSLKEANKILLKELNEDLEKSFPNLGLAVANEYATHFGDGTYGYDHDGYHIETKRIDLPELRGLIRHYAEDYLSGSNTDAMQMEIEDFVGFGIPAQHFRDFDDLLDNVEGNDEIPDDYIEALVDDIINQ